MHTLFVYLHMPELRIKVLRKRLGNQLISLSRILTYKIVLIRLYDSKSRNFVQSKTCFEKD